MNVQFKKGVLEMLVLRLLAQCDRYGFELVSLISKNIDMSEGTIYPLLKRLKDGGYLETYWMESTAGAPRKYYRITTLGRDTSEALAREWDRFVQSVEMIISGKENDDD